MTPTEARLLDLLRRALPCVEMRLACPSLAADIREALREEDSHEDEEL